MALQGMFFAKMLLFIPGNGIFLFFRRSIQKAPYFLGRGLIHAGFAGYFASVALLP
jgi:hypothetical protein